VPADDERHVPYLEHAARLGQGAGPAVLSVAGRALRTAEESARPGEVAMARVLARNGAWVILHGACLMTRGRPRVAVIIEPARPAGIAELLMTARDLSPREQEVTRLVLQGAATEQIAGQLVISVHTVRQHLKSIFGKARVRSRGRLSAASVAAEESAI
jgi:DNA-binding CsgD family transcriptional regulator